MDCNMSDEEYDDVTDIVAKAIVDKFNPGDMHISDAAECIEAIHGAGFALVPIERARMIGRYPWPEPEYDGDAAQSRGR